MHTTAEKLCTCDLDTPKNGVPGSFCSHKVFVIAVQLRCVNENSAGRATDCPPIKINHLERYTSPEWPAHASNNRRSAPHAFGPRKRPGNSLHSMCSQRHIKQRAQTSGAPPTARPSKCTISSIARAWSSMTTLKPQQRSTHVLEHAQTHHTGSLCTQRCSQQHLR